MPLVERVQQELASATSLDDFFGKEGIFARLFAATIKQMLEAELSAHLGYEPYAAEGRNSDNSRNGKRTRSLRSSAGDTTISILPRRFHCVLTPQFWDDSCFALLLRIGNGRHWEPLTSWQLDFKDASTVSADAEGKRQHVVEVLNTVDVGTSMLLGAEARADYTMATAIEAVAQTVQQHGLPEHITFDRDPRFVGSNTQRDCPSPFVRF
jgi:hypothetical protein